MQRISAADPMSPPPCAVDTRRATCVTVKTKTRSKNSSSVDTRLTGVAEALETGAGAGTALENTGDCTLARTCGALYSTHHVPARRTMGLGPERRRGCRGPGAGQAGARTQPVEGRIPD